MHLRLVSRAGIPAGPLPAGLISYLRKNLIPFNVAGWDSYHTGLNPEGGSQEKYCKLEIMLSPAETREHLFSGDTPLKHICKKIMRQKHKEVVAKELRLTDDFLRWFSDRSASLHPLAEFILSSIKIPAKMRLELYCDSSGEPKYFRASTAKWLFDKYLQMGELEIVKTETDCVMLYFRNRKNGAPTLRMLYRGDARYPLVDVKVWKMNKENLMITASLMRNGEYSPEMEDHKSIGQSRESILDFTPGIRGLLYAEDKPPEIIPARVRELIARRKVLRGWNAGEPAFLDADAVLASKQKSEANTLLVRELAQKLYLRLEVRLSDA